MSNRISRTAGYFILTVCLSLSPLYGKGPLPIPESEITALRTELATFKTSRRSLSIRRRACKGLIRNAKKLINTRPTSSNRFEVLALMLTAQRFLLKMEKAKRNRDAFYETCEALAKAPDNYSSYRLTAELLLSDRDLSEKDADAKDRIKALEAMVSRYRDTSAELECLMKVIKLAPQLGTPGLEMKKKLMTSLGQRFADNATAIAFRRKLLGKVSLKVVFSGTFERLKGSPVVFPHDRLGHPYFVVFWSKDSPAAITRLKQLKVEQEKLPGAVEIYSLNVDELPDGGKSVLDSIGLKCTILRLPGGKLGEAYRTYALRQPAAVRVNYFGLATLPYVEAHEGEEEAAAPDKGASHGEGKISEFAYPASYTYQTGIVAFDRYATQLQCLFIGDFLVAAPPSTAQVKAMDACFVRPPMRYRLSKSEALANYMKAYELSTQAIAGSKSNSWRLQNYRIIALMGMANLSGSAEYFDQAVKESRKVLNLTLPEGADVPARFCLAMSALRKGALTPKAIIEGFVAECGGDKAGPSAHGAACVLAMAANSQDLYQRFRAAFLKSDVPSTMNAMVSFLRDRYHQFYLFKTSPNFTRYTRVYRFAETRHLIDNSLTPMKTPLPPFKVKTLDGKTLSLPDTETDKLTVLVFVEPPREGNELPRQIYGPAPKPTTKNPKPFPGGELGYAFGVEKIHVNKGVKVVTVFLSDNAKRVEAIRDEHSLPGTVTMLPGGLANPIVNRLGLLSMDRSANVMLLRRDGTIAWRKHGLPYHMIGAHRHSSVATAGLRHHIDACDAEAGYRALKAKDYRLALKLFSETPGGIHKWTPSFAHGRALTHLALKDYDSALKEIECAYDKILACHGGFKVRVWSFNYSPDKPCTSMLHMLTTKAKILDHLGRHSEAKTARNTVAAGATDYPSKYFDVKGFHRPFEAFEDRMAAVAKEIK